MAEMIRVYHGSELGYLKLNTFVDFCNGMLKRIAEQNGSSVRYQLTLEETYFDIGQDWRYTCPITNDSGTERSWQSLCPRDYELLLESDSFEQISNYATAYVDHVINRTDDVDFSKIV